MFKMNIILSDVSRYNGSKGIWKDVFKYYVSNPSYRVIFLHRLYHQWYHILSKIPMGKGLFSLYYKHICRQSGIQLSLGAVLLNEQADSSLKVGASLLLEDKNEFCKWYSLCSKEDVENIKRFPIWRFYNNTLSKEALL